MGNNNDAAIVFLEKYFDIAFAAPDGVKKLRELILTLAMQGKLVPQDINDQPASELLKEIEKEKQRLVKDGKIKKSKPLPEIKLDEVPYNLPKGWEWVALINIGNWAIGSGFPLNIQGDTTQEIFMCKVSDMNILGNEKYIHSVNNTISEESAKKHKINIHESGTIVFPKIGGAIATNKRRLLSRKTAIDNNCLGIMPHKQIDVEWAYQLLSWFDFSKYQTGTSVPAISQGVIGGIVIGLPPLAEQRRIVAKIDELMARCDELEKLRSDRDRKQITVHNSALNRLLIAKEQSDFNTSWQFITQHFSELYSVKENVTELRKTILQLAVMGKLVPQNINDQPASELLKEIEAEKQRLVKKGKIKQSKPLPEIKPDEILYELPKGWKWVRLGNISQIIGGFAYKSNSFQMEGTKQVLRLGNIRPDRLRLNENPVFINDSIGELTSEYCLLKNDILITMTGTRAKRDYLYTVCIEKNPIDGVSLYLNQRVGAIRLFFESRYINMALKVEVLKDVIFLSATGSANQANIGISNLREWVLPLPPLAEQHRIVTKIDQLMALCDNLEKQIDNANSKQTNLLNAVITKI
jgi:type I restriction enzyme S subunit